MNHVIRSSILGEALNRKQPYCSMPFIDRTPDFKKTLLERENNTDVKRKKSRRREEPPRDNLGQLGKSYLREAYNVVSTWVENLMICSDNSR